jgi:PAS domain-containing protein
MGWEPRQKDLVLILARDVAARLATPMFIVDAKGTLVFFNEAAEPVLGQTFADAGEMPVDEWSTMFQPARPDGTPIPVGELPLGIALYEGRPDHATFQIKGADGVTREIAVTAIPLQTHPTETVGAIALFWSKEAGAA